MSIEQTQPEAVACDAPDLCGCAIPQGDASGFCAACGRGVPIPVLLPKLPPLPDTRLTSAKGATEIFEEVRKIAVGFMARIEQVETQLNMIVATCYMNLKKQAEDGDDWARAMVTWLDIEIAKLNAIKARYDVSR